MQALCYRDGGVIEAALAIIGRREPHEARVMRIRDTLAVETLEVSEPCLGEPHRQTELEVIGEPWTLAFDGQGNLPALGAC